jgi:hypothetical protein
MRLSVNAVNFSPLMSLRLSLKKTLLYIEPIQEFVPLCPSHKLVYSPTGSADLSTISQEVTGTIARGTISLVSSTVKILFTVCKPLHLLLVAVVDVRVSIECYQLCH